MTNPFNVEKAAQKYQQLAKDALTAGDPVLHENYLQHAEHFNRRLAELNGKPKEQKIESSTNDKKIVSSNKDQKVKSPSLADELNNPLREKKN
jgi:CHASE3 domain sensor protein